MALIDDIKAGQLAARKARNTVKATLLTTLINEATTGLAATLRTEGVNAINKRLGKGEITQDQADADIAKFDAEFNKDWLPNDEQVQNVIAKFVKGARENLSAYEARGNSEKADEVTQEIDILLDFMPKQLSADELTEIISNFKAENPGVNMGQVMAHLAGNYKGRYDGKMASQLAKG